MPDAKNNAKLTGDTHPPDVEDTGPAAAQDDDEADTAAARNENQAAPSQDREGTGGERNKG